MKSGDVIQRPWGNERIIELNDKYCVKIITINNGHRLSLQYHEKKIETLVVLSGHGKVEIEGEKIQLHVNCRPITIMPGQKHRICNPETGCQLLNDNLVILECSSPEVDDVVRLQDDYGRCPDKFHPVDVAILGGDPSL